MSIKKLVTKTGEIRWIARTYESGRGSKRLFKSFEKKIDAENFLASKREERSENSLGGSAFEDRTFKTEAEFWIKQNEIQFSASHLKRVKGVLKEILPKFGDLPVERITPELLVKFQKAEKLKGSADGTVNRKTEVFTSILSFSLKHRRIRFNPASGFQKLRYDSSEMLFWSEEEASDFLREMDQRHASGSEGRWRYAVYLLALNTALRAGEIWGLKPIDLAQGGRLIHVRRQFNRVTLDFSTTKGKKPRIVPCSEELALELREVMKRDLKAVSDPTIFQNFRGKPVCHENFTSREFADDLNHWGGRVVRFHDLRHTAATLMVSNNIDLKTVKEICGHADIATTMGYAHLVGGAVEKVSETFSISGARKEKIVSEIVQPKAGGPFTVVRRGGERLGN